MRNLIVSDIFGRTHALETLASMLTMPTDFYDPYSAEQLEFADEQAAYSYFQQHVTLKNYSANLLEQIKSSRSPLNLIGFSVGASAIWQISDTNNLINVNRACCYYSSQIRHYLHVEPHFPVTLVFPASENHFSLTPIMDSLANKQTVSVRQVPYLHGFMNPHSVNYNQQGYNDEMLALDNVLLNSIE
ncbi:MAG: hypothetical protein HWE26_06920 [Alteromonadaceae bacterium]|nr:hypothetical protein [Alteromonadaceae bacterium]